MKKILLCFICLVMLAGLCACKDKDGDDKNNACVTCTDGNADHKCDVCKKSISTCKDDDKDHNCDVCKKALTECADANKDHTCDTCQKKISECTDANNDKLCDDCGKSTQKPVQLPPIDIPLG